MSETKSYHHENLREVLLAETAVMIAENGVDSVTMRGLAQRVGVSRGAPYRHFADKASLLKAVAEDGFRRLGQKMAAANSGEDPLQDFYEIGVAYIHFALENPTHYRLMFGPEGFKRAGDEVITAVANETYMILQNAIELCQERGLIKPEDSCHLGYATWAMVHGTANLLIDQLTHGDIDDETFIQVTFQTLASGMMVTPS